LSYGNSQKSHGTKKGEYGGCEERVHYRDAQTKSYCPIILVFLEKLIQEIDTKHAKHELFHPNQRLFCKKLGDNASKYITDNNIDNKFGPDVIKNSANSRK